HGGSRAFRHCAARLERDRPHAAPHVALGGSGARQQRHLEIARQYLVAHCGGRKAARMDGRLHEHRERAAPWRMVARKGDPGGAGVVRRVGLRLLAAGGWLLVAGGWLLVAGGWRLALTTGAVRPSRSQLAVPSGL